MYVFNHSTIIHYSLRLDYGHMPRHYHLQTPSQVANPFSQSVGASASPSPYHNEYSAGYTSPNYAAMSGGNGSGVSGSSTHHTGGGSSVQQGGSFPPVSTPQSLITNPTYSR